MANAYLSRNSPGPDPVGVSPLPSASGEVPNRGQFLHRHPSWKRLLGHLELVFLVCLALFSSDFSVLAIRNAQAFLICPMVAGLLVFLVLVSVL